MDFHFAVGDGGLPAALQLLHLFLQEPRWVGEALGGRCFSIRFGWRKGWGCGGGGGERWGSSRQDGCSLGSTALPNICCCQTLTPDPNPNPLGCVCGRSAALRGHEQNWVMNTRNLLKWAGASPPCRWESSAMERAKQMWLSHYRSLPKSLDRATTDRILAAMLGLDRRFRWVGGWGHTLAWGHACMGTCMHSMSAHLCRHPHRPPALADHPHTSAARNPLASPTT
jgi:hypothetical protein